jgi:acyl carrier protein
VVALEQQYGIKIADGEVGKEAFASVNTLAEFVANKKPAA